MIEIFAENFSLISSSFCKNAWLAFNKCLPFDFRENYLKWKVPIMRTFWITQICTLKISCIQFESVGAFFGKYSTLLYDIFHSRVTQYRCQLKNSRYLQTYIMYQLPCLSCNVTFRYIICICRSIIIIPIDWAVLQLY